MPSGGNRYDGYHERYKVTGRLKMERQADEDAIQLLADGTPKEEVAQMLDGKITAEEIDALLASPTGQRRFQFVQQKKAREEFEPSTPDEVLTYVKQRLVKISKEGDDKNKITALKALAEVAIDERENKSGSDTPKLTPEEIKQLESFGNGG